MEPLNHSQDSLVGPNAIMVVYLEPFGYTELLYVGDHPYKNRTVPPRPSEDP